MPNYTDTHVNDMIFNVLDSATYNTLLNNNQLNNNQLYFITNDGGSLEFTKDNQSIASYNGTSNVTIDLTTATNATNDGAGNNIVDTYIPKSIGTTKGDIIYWSGNKTPVRLGIGSNGQVLKVNSSGIPAWSSDSNTDTKVKLTAPTVSTTIATYPIVLGPTSITSGTAYEANYNTGVTVKLQTVSNATESTITATKFDGLATKATSDAAGNNINDTYIKKSIGTAKGDIIYWSSNGTPTRLGIGSTNQVLKVNSSGIPAWSSDTDTDTKVKLTSQSATTTSTDYPIIFGPASISSGTAYEALYNSAIKVRLNSTSGSAETGIVATHFHGLADKATKDGADNVITDTYAKKDGSNASGTWGINISGNAKSVGNGSHTAAVTANEFDIPVGSATIVGNVSNTSMTHTNNANAEMIIKTHPSSGTNYYEARLGFSSNGSLYYMPVNTTTWKTIAYTDSNVATATKLATPRKLEVFLQNTSTDTTFDGSADVTNIRVGGTLGVGNGGTGMTTTSYKNAVVIGNASTPTNAMRTIRTASGAFYATEQDGAPTFGTLPVAQGGTGATSFTANSVVISGSNTTAALTTRSITDSTSNSAIGTSTSIPTERDVYYGLVTVNGSSQTRATGIYAPTSAGTSGYVLVSSGGGAPTWTSGSLTDEKVKQNNTTSNTTYRILLSGSANDTTETTTSNKNTNLTYNPSTGLTVNNDFYLGSTSSNKGRIYSALSGTVSGSETVITNSNVSTYFTQEAIDATYPWTYDATNQYWYVGGTTQDVHNLNNIVTIQWKAASSFALKVHAMVHSENNYDFFRIWVNDIQKFELSGNNKTADTIVFLKQNDVIKIIFRKDGSSNPSGEYYRATLARQAYSDLYVVTVKQPLYPETDNTYTLGSTGQRWKNVYAETFTGLATQATSDGAGNNIVDTYIKKAIGTTKGDIIYWSSANTPTRIGIGSSGQVLKVNSSGIPAWSDDTDIKVKLTSKSDNVTYPIILGPNSITSGTAYEAYYNSNIKVNPSTGTITATTFDGTATKATKDGADNTITDTYIKKSIGTAAGDLIYWSAASTPTRLAKGTNGYVLKMVNNVPAWAEDSNTDTKVSLTSTSTTGSYPLIFGPTSITSGNSYGANYNTGITVNPNTKTITATAFDGTATKATGDGAGNNIVDTYIKKAVGTTKGDILYWSAASTPARLGIGSEGQVLQVNSSGLPVWSTVATVSAQIIRW